MQVNTPAIAICSSFYSSKTQHLFKCARREDTFVSITDVRKVLIPLTKLDHRINYCKGWVNKSKDGMHFLIQLVGRILIAVRFSISNYTLTLQRILEAMEKVYYFFK